MGSKILAFILIINSIMKTILFLFLCVSLSLQGLVRREAEADPFRRFRPARHGYNSGYNSGYNAGYNTGYNSYNSGYNSYNNGYNSYNNNNNRPFRPLKALIPLKVAGITGGLVGAALAGGK